MIKRFIALGVSFVVSLTSMSLMQVKPQSVAVKTASVQESKASSSEVSMAPVEAVQEAPQTLASSVVSTNSTAARGAVSRGAEVQKQSVSRFGEALDWWKEARNDFPRGAVAEVTDLQTGRSFMVKRTYGTNHADCEALTLEDTNIIKSIWGGFSWKSRPVIVKINGLRIAASMAAMPHAGVDSKPANAKVSNRSEGYGTGTNFDTVKGNGMDGHFDIHFLNSRRHYDNQKDTKHQANVMIAAGE